MLSRTENAIIDAFNRLMDKNDFNKISVEMILDTADVSRSTFYRYFKDKYEVTVFFFGFNFSFTSVRQRL